jgi:hypothetical protein
MSSAKDAELSSAEILAAERLLDRARAPRAIPVYSPEERFALAILVADQKARGKKSKSPAKQRAEYRRDRVNLILRYVLPKKYRRNDKAARSGNAIMTMIDWLDGLGIEASATQVRRDIEASLAQGPLPTD